MTIGAEVLGGSDGAARGEQVFHNGIEAGVLTKDEVRRHSRQSSSHESPGYPPVSTVTALTGCFRVCEIHQSAN